MKAKKLFHSLMLGFSMVILLLLLVGYAYGRFGPVAEGAPLETPQVYDWTYNITNLYNDGLLVYIFDGLDTSTTYTWSVEGLNQNGVVIKTFREVVRGPGFTSGTVVFKYEEDVPWDVGGGMPLRVVDNFGQVLGQHFMAASPVLSTWPCSCGVLADDEKTMIRSPGFEWNEKAPMGPYPSYEHFAVSANPAAVTTAVGGYALLHYRVPNPGDPWQTDSEIELRRIVDGELVATFLVQELVEYQKHFDNGAYDPDVWNSFVALSTDGKAPVWIYNAQSVHAYDGVYDIPHLLNVGPGVYDYARIDDPGGTPATLEGESLWVVTSWATGIEWELRLARETAKSGDTQTARMTANTDAVWAATQVQALTDSGVVSSDISQGVLSSEYERIRRIKYEIESVDGEEVVTWYIQPTTLSFGQSPTSFAFTLLADYAVPESVSWPDKVKGSVTDFGLDDGFGAVLIVLSGTLGVAVLLRGKDYPPFLIAVVFSALSVVVIALDIGGTAVNMMLGIIAVVFIVATIGRGSAGEKA